MELVIRVLGPFELIRKGTAVAAGGPTQRAVLAMLALDAGQLVDVDRLVDGIWGDSDRSPGGRSTIWPHISRIRASLQGRARQPLTTVAGGYRLDPEAITVDARDFERLLGIGRGQLADANPGAALASFDGALALWRGPALMDLREFPFAVGVASRYDLLRVDATEERIEACLALGEASSLVPELRALVAQHPYRERLHGQLMVALYRAGQQAAALEAYQAARDRLTMDLGVEPGPELDYLLQQILQHSPELAAPMASTPRPAPSGPGVRPGRRLPRAPDLIGRETLLGGLERLARAERLITLVGPGGSGKTVLALAFAHRLLPRFPDGAAFVDLAAVDHPAQVIPAISDALGMSPMFGRLAPQVAEYLSERQALVLLDNVEHVVDAAPDLDAIVEATGGLVVATSRTPLGLRAERLVEVPPLPVPGPGASAARLARQPAVQLFERAATALGGVVGTAPGELAAVGEICRIVEGLPLAIEIAAAQTRAEGVQELASRIRDQLPRLRGRGRNIPTRQQTLDAAIGWSLDLLDAEDRTCLYRLTAFAGPFGADGAAAVCDLDRDRAIGLLTALLDASLLARQPVVGGRARFRLLEPVRAVARARADQSLVADAAGRHAAFMAAQVDRLCPGSTGIRTPADLAQLRADHHDLMAGFAYLAAKDPDRGARMVGQLHDYWSWTARETDARHVADALLQAGRVSDPAACVVLAECAWDAMTLGQFDDARRALDRAGELADAMSDPEVSALLPVLEAVYAVGAGGWSLARARRRDAARWASADVPTRIDVLSLAIQAVVEANGSALAPGLDARLDGALRLAREGPMPAAEAWILFLRAALDDQDLGLSIRLERSALEICRRFAAPESSLASALSANLSSHLLLAGSADEARALALASLHASDQMGHRTWASMTIALLGEAEAEAEQAERAMVLITASQAQMARLGIAGMLGDQERRRIEGVIARLERELGDERATAARTLGGSMSYREAVAFALQVRSLGRHRRRRRVPARVPAAAQGRA